MTVGANTFSRQSAHHLRGASTSPWMPAPAREVALSPMGRARAALARPLAMEQRTDVDLRKLRTSLRLTPQYVAALAGVTDMTLLRCEDRQDDPEMVEDLLAVYAMYMATRWGAELLNLTEANLTETSR